MKRIILGLSLFLMLVQNGFAETDAEYDKMIANDTLEVNKQIYRCNKATLNHPDNSNPNICTKAVELEKKLYPNNEEILSTLYLNTGVLYSNSKQDYLKAYQFYIKSAKLGNIHAQKNLDLLCKRHSWVCN